MNSEPQNTSQPESVQTRCHRFCLRDGYLYGELVPGDIDLEEAEASIQAITQLCGNLPVAMLLDLKKAGQLSREARLYYKQQSELGRFCCIAMLVNSPFGMLIGNFMIGLNRMGIPVKLFNDEKAAVKWIKGHIHG